MSPSLIHLWRAKLDQLESRIQQFFRILSPDEKERARRFLFIEGAFSNG
jgi:hypothetical protein